MSILRCAAGIFSAGVLLLGAGAVSGQEPSTGSGQVFPSRPIRILCGGAGGGSDFTSRIVAQGISGSLGQPVTVENRAPLLSGEIVIKSPPDGHTLLITGSQLWQGPLFRKMSYDPLKDFVHVGLLTIEPNVLIMHPSLPVKSVKELMVLAKANPAALNYAFSSIGASDYVAGELLKSMAKVNIVGIAYKSNAQLQADMFSGQVQLSFQSGAKVMPYVQAGRLKALAVSTAQPTALAPGLPTVAASGLPGFESVAMFGAFAPAKTPAPIIRQLNQEILRVINQPAVKQKFFDSGTEVVGTSPEEFTGKIKAEMDSLSKVIKEAGIRVE